MLHRRLCRAALLVVLFCSVGSSTYAQAPPEAVGMEDGVPSRVLAQCQIGQLGPGSFGSQGVLRPRAKFLQLLDPSQCTACPSPQSLVPVSVAIRLRFLEACTVVLRVSVVEVLGTSNCPPPDTLHFICPPTLHTIGEPAAALTKDYVMPLVVPCCLTRKAFLSIQVVSVSCPPNRIAWTYSETCTPCSQYVTTPFLPGGIHEQCASGYRVNYRMWMDADCCDPTSAIRSSWSRLKVLYR